MLLTNDSHKMRIHFVLSLAACLFINLIRAAEAEEWKISPTFDFQVASRFSWPLRPGVNLINIHVIGVHNSSAKLKLTRKYSIRSILDISWS